MRKIDVVFGILLCLGLSLNSNGQVSKENSSEVINDRFAYSCGVLAGANFKDIGLSENLVDLNKIWKGIEGFMTGQTEITVSAAQKMTQAKTSELQGHVEDIKPSKESLARFYYNYGVVIGANWKVFKIDFKTIVKTDFNNGLLAALSNKALLSPESAQKEVSSIFKSIKMTEAEGQRSENQKFLQKNQEKKEIITLESGIQYEILKEGSGKQVSNFDELITAHYHGTLTNGKVFDSSVQRDKPITFKLTGVIKGWQEVIPLMEEGEKIRVYVPSYLGYGNQQRKNIPANSILVFEIELLKVG